MVDSLELLEEAKKLLHERKLLAVDIEGRLRSEGYVELIQISTSNVILVFDIYPNHGSAISLTLSGGGISPGLPI